MYVCPICNKEYPTEEAVAKCFLQCWKENNPIHKSKNAPRTEDRVERQCTQEIEDFFKGLEERK